MNVTQYTTRDLHAMVLKIMDDYRRATIQMRSPQRKTLNEIMKYSLRFMNKTLDDLTPMQFILTVDAIIESMSDNVRDVFIAMFVTREYQTNPLWYINYNLSRSTYYRYRRKALEEFMGYF